MFLIHRVLCGWLAACLSHSLRVKQEMLQYHVWILSLTLAKYIQTQPISSWHAISLGQIAFTPSPPAATKPGRPDGFLVVTLAWTPVKGHWGPLVGRDIAETSFHTPYYSAYPIPNSHHIGYNRSESDTVWHLYKEIGCSWGGQLVVIHDTLSIQGI